MDLHELESGVWYLYTIDHFTCFNTGNIVKARKVSEIINFLVHSWISVYGQQRRLYSDIGRSVTMKK